MQNMGTNHNAILKTQAFSLGGGTVMVKLPHTDVNELKKMMANLLWD